MTTPSGDSGIDTLAIACPVATQCTVAGTYFRGSFFHHRFAPVVEVSRGG